MFSIGRICSVSGHKKLLEPLFHFSRRFRGHASMDYMGGIRSLAKWKSTVIEPLPRATRESSLWECSMPETLGEVNVR